MNDQAENNRYDNYHVLISGEIKPGFQLNQVINNIAALFSLPKEKIAPLFNQQNHPKKPIIIKSNQAHKKAYHYQQQLEKCGAQSSIQGVLTEEIESTFTMVPEGEEQTGYEELAQRLSNGEEVICTLCETQQTLTSTCQQCGKPLLAKTIKIIEVDSKNNNSILMIIGITAAILVMLFIVI